MSDKPEALATEYQRGWSDCMELWADHMRRMNAALTKPLPYGYANHAYHLRKNFMEALDSAPSIAIDAARKATGEAAYCSECGCTHRQGENTLCPTWARKP